MAKNFLETAGTFAKNIGRHAQRIVSRRETPGQAWSELQKDAQKLKKVIDQKSLSSDERESLQLVSAGRRAYNNRDYEKAEAFFRQALVSDINNCTAQTYLGHALYKQGRIKDAKHSWERAVEIAPTVDAGEKARQKLLMLQKKLTSTVEELEDRIRRNR